MTSSDPGQDDGYRQDEPTHLRRFSDSVWFDLAVLALFGPGVVDSLVHHRWGFVAGGSLFTAWPLYSLPRRIFFGRKGAPAPRDEQGAAETVVRDPPRTQRALRWALVVAFPGGSLVGLLVCVLHGDSTATVVYIFLAAAIVWVPFAIILKDSRKDNGDKSQPSSGYRPSRPRLGQGLVIVGVTVALVLFGMALVEIHNDSPRFAFGVLCLCEFAPTGVVFFGAFLFRMLQHRSVKGSGLNGISDAPLGE